MEHLLARADRREAGGAQERVPALQVRQKTTGGGAAHLARLQLPLEAEEAPDDRDLHLGNPEGSREPEVAKSPKAAFRQKERFRRAAAVRSRLVIGHIRSASNPRGLPKKKLLGLENTQPFSDGPYAFAHNGTLNQPDAAAARLGPLRPRLKGVNDSEVFFYQFLKFLRIKGDAPRAFEACVEELASLPRTDDRPPHWGLNVVASDGEALYAFCHYPRTGKRGFCSPAPWGRLAYRDEGDRLLVSSERLGGRGWKLFDDPQVLTAWRKDGRIRTEFKKLSKLEEAVR